MSGTVKVKSLIHRCPFCKQYPTLYKRDRVIGHVKKLERVYTVTDYSVICKRCMCGTMFLTSRYYAKESWNNGVEKGYLIAGTAMKKTDGWEEIGQYERKE